MRKNVIVCFLIFVFAVTGCGKDDKSKVVAEVNETSITDAEFDAYLKFKRVPAENETRRQKLFDQYLDRVALADAVEKQPLLDKDLINAELREFRKEMLISRYFEKFLKDKVSQEAIKNYYNTHASDYEQRKVHVAHILIRTNKKMSEIERKAKLTTAQEAYSKIRADEDFAVIAEIMSEDRISAKKGGDLGWIKEGSIDPLFSQKVFEMEPGTVSEPFSTQCGFHVVKLIEGPKIVKQPFETVAGDIRYQLRAKAKKAETQRLMSLMTIEKK